MVSTRDMDTISQRVAAVGLTDASGNKIAPDVFVDIQITATVPMYIAKADIIEKTTIREVVSTPATDLINGKLIDPEYEAANGGVGRFIFVTSIESPLTRNIQQIYFDRRYNDMFMIADMEYYNNVDKVIPTGTYASATATRIGCGMVDQSGNYMDNFLPAPGEGSRRDFALPKPCNENIAIKSKLCTFNGIDVDSKNRGIRIWTKLGDNSGILRGDITPISVIELGTMAELFGESFPMPLYYMYQLSHEKFQMNYAGIADPKQNKLYISLKI